VNRRLLDVVLVANLADDLLENVFDGHEPRSAAIFVAHNRDVTSARLKFAQLRVDSFRNGDV
jgi:hypothetical protein